MKKEDLAIHRPGEEVKKPPLDPEKIKQMFVERAGMLVQRLKRHFLERNKNNTGK